MHARVCIRKCWFSTRSTPWVRVSFSKKFPPLLSSAYNFTWQQKWNVLDVSGKALAVQVPLSLSKIKEAKYLFGFHWLIEILQSFWVIMLLYLRELVKWRRPLTQNVVSGVHEIVTVTAKRIEFLSGDIWRSIILCNFPINLTRNDPLHLFLGC